MSFNNTSDIPDDCAICGLPLNEKYCHELTCKHVFHYECLVKTFKSSFHSTSYKRRCPYCRSQTNYLPIINGLKKIEIGIHAPDYEKCYNMQQNHSNIQCKHVLKKGKRKGEECGKNCKLGYEYCASHKI